MTTNEREQVATNTQRRANWGANIPRVDQDDKPRAGRSVDMQTGFGRHRGR